MAAPRFNLVVVHSFHAEARTACAQTGAISAAKAVLLLDLAVEQALSGLVSDFYEAGDAGEHELKWGELWRRAQSGLSAHGKAGLPHPRELRGLHVLRNLVQHNATLPTEAEAKRYLAPAEEMFRQVFRDGYGLDFDRFRVWDLVDAPALRAVMREAEEVLEEGFALGALAACVSVHRRIISAMMGDQRGRTYQRGHEEAQLGYVGPEAVRDLAFQTQAAIKELRERVEANVESLEQHVVALSAGLPAVDTLRFLRIAASLHLSENSEGRWWVVRSDSPAREDVNFVLGYLWRLVMRAQESDSTTLGDVSVPLLPRRQPGYAAWKGREEAQS